MGKKITYKNHLTKAEDLVTPIEQTRAGFISIALEKNNIAIPFVEQAKALKILAQNAKRPTDLLKYEKLRPGLLTASGLSDKAINYLNKKDKTTAIQGLIENYLEPAGNDFINELVYRYLLFKGDALGGKARNLAGILAEKMFIRSFISILDLYKFNYYWLNIEDYKWKNNTINNDDLFKRVKGIYWSNGKKDRLLVLNINVPKVKKNVDVCIFDGKTTDLQLKPKNNSSIHKFLKNYVALGEIKGGIDPAGADEHWKTASTALTRIRNTMADQKINAETFFIGAAIVNSMANEIYEQLEQNILNNAANLLNEKQLFSICDWMLSL